MPVRPSQSDQGELIRVIGEFSRQVAEMSSKVGELTGQVREQIHTSNNTQMMVRELGDRLSKLEANDQRREGAVGVVQMILKSPLIGWLVGAGISAWAVLTGKVHI